jgi:hypothetical protein
MVVQKAVSAIKIVNDSCARAEWGWKPAYSTIGDLVPGFIREMQEHPQYFNL